MCDFSFARRDAVALSLGGGGGEGEGKNVDVHMEELTGR